jgi:hypothetical protein
MMIMRHARVKGCWAVMQARRRPGLFLFENVSAGQLALSHS